MDSSNAEIIRPGERPFRDRQWIVASVKAAVSLLSGNANCQFSSELINRNVDKFIDPIVQILAVINRVVRKDVSVGHSVHVKIESPISVPILAVIGDMQRYEGHSDSVADRLRRRNQAACLQTSAQAGIGPVRVWNALPVDAVVSGWRWWWRRRNTTRLQASAQAGISAVRIRNALPIDTTVPGRRRRFAGARPALDNYLFAPAVTTTTMFRHLYLALLTTTRFAPINSGRKIPPRSVKTLRTRNFSHAWRIQCGKNGARCSPNIRRRKGRRAFAARATRRWRIRSRSSSKRFSGNRSTETRFCWNTRSAKSAAFFGRPRRLIYALTRSPGALRSRRLRRAPTDF